MLRHVPVASGSVRHINVAGAPGAQNLPMETKDTFMRFVVVASIVVVGALAFLVRSQG